MVKPFFSEKNYQESLINEKELNESIKIFRRDGFLWMNNIFPTHLIDNLNKEVNRQISKTNNFNKSAWPTQKDNLRTQLTLEIDDIFPYADIYGSKKVFQVLNEIFKINGVSNNKVKQIYKKIVIDSFTSISSFPKCSEQHLHSDGSGLFDSPIDQLLPTHAVILGIPLVDLNQFNGTTEIFPGSHMKRKSYSFDKLCKPFLYKGDCYLMDYRLVHRGMANKSNTIRNIIFVRYCLPWWRDIANFRRIVSSKNISFPLKITKEGFLNIPRDLKYLFRYYE